MSAHPDDIREAKELLQAEGYVVLRAKSYYQAQERQRVAEALRAMAEEMRASQDRWMREDVFPEKRRLHERLTFVYGVARAHGATIEELGRVNPEQYRALYEAHKADVSVAEEVGP